MRNGWIRIGICVAAVAGQWGTGSSDGAPHCGDREVPNWTVPGDFETALARAREENRLLVIKGVAFGIDRLGATCPTQGHW